MYWRFSFEKGQIISCVCVMTECMFYVLFFFSSFASNSINLSSCFLSVCLDKMQKSQQKVQQHDNSQSGPLCETFRNTIFLRALEGNITMTVVMMIVPPAGGAAFPSLVIILISD